MKLRRSTKPATPKASSAAIELALEAVWQQPESEAVRQVVADALMEQGDPWGELIEIQLRLAGRSGSAADRRRVAELVKANEGAFAGPLARVCVTKPWVFERGFLVECAPQRRGASPAEWKAAATAPHWATVRRVMMDLLHTPRWWITALAQNPASRGLRTVDLGDARYKPNLRLERASADEPWRVTKGHHYSGYGKLLAAFVAGLPPSERATVGIAAAVPARQRTMLEAALTAGSAGRSGSTTRGRSAGPSRTRMSP